MLNQSFDLPSIKVNDILTRNIVNLFRFLLTPG